mmetsp:Transcript_21894/g.51140  ORF Transcript_21894/g.51140 Transcript_21894/m.51140 type:complete len:597 (+) Transcript_21894:87-1877(+)
MAIARLFRLAVLLGIHGAAAVVATERSASASSQVMAQVRSTLKDLLRSVQEETTRAAEVVQLRTEWCSSAQQNVNKVLQASNTSLNSLMTHLNEHEAATADVEGIARQLKADIAATGATLRLTEEMAAKLANSSTAETASDLKVLQAMADTKRQGLASLHAELQVALPALAQMQARVAEAKCRVGDRGDSINAATELLQVVKDSCSTFSTRAALDEQAREEQTAAITNGLKSLETSEPATLQLRGGRFTGGESFLQVQSESGLDEELQSFFSDGSPASAAAPARRVEVHPHRTQPKTALLHSAKAAWRQASSAAPKVSEVLAQLKGLKRAPENYENEEEWCTDTRHEHELVVRLAKDSISMLATTASEHDAAAQSLQADLDSIDRTVADLNSSQTLAAGVATKERELTNDVLKSRQLAVKILKQTMAIVAKARMDDAGKNTSAMLKAAKATFEHQTKAFAARQLAAEGTSKQLLESFGAALAAEGRERTSVEYLHGEHAAQRTQGADSTKEYEAEASRSQNFLQKLSEVCSVDGRNARNQELRAQVEALQDAQDVMTGKKIQDSWASAGKSGQHQGQALSPLERAALALGVPVNSH